MTRHDHRGRFTSGSLPAPRETGVPLLLRRPKCARVSKGNRTRAMRQRERVMRVKAALDRELSQ